MRFLRFSPLSSQLLGPVHGRTDFSRIFIFEPPDFFADFLAGFFLLIFVGKRAQKNPPRKSPGKSSKIYTTKSATHFCRGAGPIVGRKRASFPEITKLEKAGTVHFNKHPARKVGQCRPKVLGRFAFPGAPNPRHYSISRKSGETFSRNFPTAFPEFSSGTPEHTPKQRVSHSLLECCFPRNFLGGNFRTIFLPGAGRNQRQPKGNNYTSNVHLMQHLDCACVVALLSATVVGYFQTRGLGNPWFAPWSPVVTLR